MDRLSHSQIKVFADSPRKYHAQFVAKTMARDESKAMDLGRIAHAAILEPHILDGHCIRIPREVLNADGHKKGKAWTEWRDAYADNLILSDGEYDQVRGMFDAVYANPYATRYLRAAGKSEATILWESDGFELRSRLDRLLDEAFVVDVKTTQDASPLGFEKSIAKYGYAQQAAFYLDAAKFEDGKDRVFVFVAVETFAPYRVGVHQIGKASVETGRGIYKNCLTEIRKRRESGKWNDWFENRINLVNLPGWYEQPILGDGE
jgi:hypothetical protein